MAYVPVAAYRRPQPVPVAMRAPWTCSVCGAPATSGARDVRRSTPRSRLDVGLPSWAYTSYLGPAKYGCDDHPVESLAVG
jgi:hypothetical protein